MSELADIELLRAYTRRGEESAFETIVSRHLRLVYGAALRRTNQPELARDITQTVFTLLARKAGEFSGGVVVAGWLVKTTRFAVARTMRDDQRRHRREQEACRMDDSSPVKISDEMAAALPLLDATLAALPSRDRDVVVLRYLEQKSFAEVARTLGATEEVARKRVQRALERLRKALGRRGVVLGTAALVAGLEATAASSAPVGLTALAVTSLALKPAAGYAVGSFFTTAIMTSSKIKILGAGAVALLIASGVAIQSFRSKPSPPAPGLVVVDRQSKDRMASLEEENHRLSEALQRAERARLVSEQSARGFRELAEKVQAENPTPLEEFPTPRHVAAGLGKMALRGVRQDEMMRALRKKYAGHEPTSAEKAEIQAAMVAQLTPEMKMVTQVMAAQEQLKMDGAWEASRTADERIDDTTCFFTGRWI